MEKASNVSNLRENPAVIENSFSKTNVREGVAFLKIYATIPVLSQ
jgi:hypothetical protein